MANISTATTAAYTAQVLRGTAKVDEVARADSEVDEFCTADWANDVDADLEEVNSVMRGAEGAYVWVAYTFAYTRADATAVYVPISGGSLGEQTATTAYTVRIPMPYDGQVVRATIESESATMGNTTMSTAVGTASDPSDLETTGTVNVAAANTGYSFDFTTTSVFSKNDLLALKITPTGNHDDVSGVVIVKYDTNT